MRRRAGPVTRLRRGLRAAIILTLLALLGLAGWGWLRAHPGDNPFAPLILSDAPGRFTRTKLVGLAGEGTRCRQLMTDAGVDFAPLPDRGEGQCLARDRILLARGGAFPVAMTPAAVSPSCPVVVATLLWTWHGLQPAAQRHYGSSVVSIEHFGSYNCRRMYGAAQGAWSEHASGNALDVAGFRLANGRRISVLRGWNGAAADRAFLREVRDSACGLFATVLSPDYNAAHADHFHLDQAQRGGGWGACR